MNYFRYMLSLFLFFFLTACGMDNTKDNTSQIMNNAMQNLAANKAMLHIYRPKKFLRGGLAAKLYLDKTQKLVIRNGEYLSFQISPGKHWLSFSKRTKPNTPANLNLVAGQHIFLKITPKYHNTMVIGSFVHVNSSFRLLKMPAATAKQEIPQVHASIGYTVADAAYSKPINGITMTCKKPYKLSQDCSFITGPKRKIKLKNIEFKIAGSADGKIILIAGKWFRSDIAAVAYNEIKNIFAKQNIKIEKVRPLKIFRKTDGYVIVANKNAYQVLSSYTIK